MSNALRCRDGQFVRSCPEIPLPAAHSRFDGFGCGQLPIPMRFRAWGTRVQLTNFLGRCAACRTGHG